MKKIILSILLLGFILGSCTKEPITPVIPPINDTIVNNDTIPTNGNYILIKSGSYYHNPKLIITTEVEIYQPDYWLIDSLDCIERDCYNWAALINGQYYEIQPVIYDYYTVIDTIISGNNYYIPRVTCNIDSIMSFQTITLQYLDNQYEYDKTLDVMFFHNFIEVNSLFFDGTGEYIECWYEGNYLDKK